MNRKVMASILGAFALSQAAAGVAAAQISVSDHLPLLQFHGVSTISTLTPGAGTNYSEPTLLVYRDGFTVASVVSGVVGGGNPQPFAAHVVQGTMPAAFASLSQALLANRIGVQGGDSLLPSTSFGHAYDFQITWYGLKSNRMTTLRISSSSSSAACPDAVKNLLDAIDAYESAIGAVPP